MKITTPLSLLLNALLAGFVMWRLLSDHALGKQ